MFNLLRYFSLTSAAVILVLALAMQAAYRQIAIDDLVALAERHNVALAQSLANTVWSRFSSYVTSVSRADGETLRAHPESRTIHETLKTLTTGLPVLKVKIYNLDGLTVYSSEPSQIGADRSENPRFLSAANKGTPASSLTYRGTFSAFSSIVYDREVVETYIPVRGAGGRIEGVFELYSDVTPLMARIRTNSTLFIVGILLSFGLLYAILLLVVRRADRILKKQYTELRSNEKGITAKNVALEHEVAQRMRVEEALLASEQALQQRVADLEEVHRKLEMQGDSLVRLADDLLIARDEARAADRTKSEFLANMSHELRTPLNAIIGFSGIIKDGTAGLAGNDKHLDYAQDIYESGQHLLSLINDILDLSKIESGTGELHERNIDTPEIANATMKLVMDLARTRDVELELDVPDDIPVLHADERKLKQILLNLLSNAIKFTPGGGKVTLKIWSRAESGFVLQIIDTGIGIASENIPKALAPFQQIDSDLNRKHDGTGLGLPLTKALVELHGGYLDLQSEVGVGTTVTVRFPAERIVELPRDTESIDTAIKKVG